MRRIKWIPALLASGSVALALAGCGEAQDPDPEPSEIVVEAVIVTAPGRIDEGNALRSELDETLSGESHSVSRTWREMNHGEVVISVTALEPFALPEGSDGCDLEAWGGLIDDREREAGAGGAPIRVLHFAPDVCRPLAGLAPFIEPMSPTLAGWIWTAPGVSVPQMLKAFGSALGFGFAAARDCAERDGRVLVADGCHETGVILEHGDPYDVMGRGTDRHGAGSLTRFGALDRRETIEAPGTYRLYASDVDATPLVLAIRLDEEWQYELVFRRPEPHDPPGLWDGREPGVLVRYASAASLDGAFLVSSGGEGRDALLIEGTAFDDTVHEIAFTVEEVGEDHVTVRVTQVPGAAPGVPA